MKKILMSSFIFIILFFLPFLLVINNSSLWKINSGNVEGKEEIINNINQFMRGKEELQYFDKDVKSHFNDVRRVYWYSELIFFTILSLGILLSFYMKKKDIINSFLFSAKSILIMCTIFIFWTIISFKSFFLVFHKLLFKGNYVFSINNLVIQLFTREFFFFMGIIIFSFEIIISIIIIVMLKRLIHKKFYNK